MVSKAKQVTWSEIRATPLVLVFGNEEYLANRSIRLLRDKLRAEAPNLEVTEIDASDYLGGAIFDYTSPSLFNEPRLVIIRSVERCTDDLITDGLAYLQDPTSETVVILRHNGSSVRGKKLLDALRASASVTEVVCSEIKDQDKAAFVAAEFQNAGKKISNSAIRALCDAFANDLAELAAACQQLIQDSQESIDDATVEKYYGGRVETNAFKVAEAAIAGQTGEALVLLRHALATGADPVPIVAAFSAKMRLIAKVFENRSSTPQQLGAQPWQIDRARRDSVGWSEAGIANVIVELARADAAAKGAERDPIFALERLLLLIARKGQAAK